MNVAAQLQGAVFLERLNRFAARVRSGGDDLLAHLPNSGRLGELLTPGRPCLLAVRPAPRRRTAADLIFMLGPQGWVSVDARLPGRLLVEHVEEGRDGRWQGYRLLQPEYRPAFAAGSRLDLLLQGPRGPVAVETKSVTLVEGGTALFPDAPTARGRRHLQVLAQARRRGMEACVVFVVQRRDARRFAPHAAADPDFAEALRRAAREGVQVLAYTCTVHPPGIAIEREIPVAWNP